MQGRHLSPHLRPLPLESANTRPRRSNQAQAEPGRGEELRYDNFKVTGQEKEGRGGEVREECSRCSVKCSALLAAASCPGAYSLQPGSSSSSNLTDIGKQTSAYLGSNPRPSLQAAQVQYTVYSASLQRRSRTDAPPSRSLPTTYRRH